MDIRLHKVIDYIVNIFCRIFKINFSVNHRVLSNEEVKALGLDKLEKGEKLERWIVEKPTEM